MAGSIADVVERLRELRQRFGRGPARARLRLLRRGAKLPLDDARLLVAFHEVLLFICCHPDNRDVLRAAEGGLRRVAKAAAEMTRRGTEKARKHLDDSGIAGTVSTVSLSLEAIEWLARRFPADTEIAWDENGSAGEGLENLLDLVARCSERDGLLDDTLTTKEWFDLARGADGPQPCSALAALMKRTESWPKSPLLGERVYETADLHVEWTLREAQASRTFLRFPKRAVRFQTGPLVRSPDVPSVIARPLGRARVLRRAEAERMIDVARAALAVRHRETDPVTYANPREITLLRLEQGIDVLLLGMREERRTPIESFFGFVAARNGIPVGYGGGWVFFHRCEIGVNIFDTFRGGESALIFANILRVYHQHYRVNRFLVDPYQFGAGNSEAIRSGAFWFYHRLGFRPVDERVEALAERERQCIAADPAYRTPAAALRRLASAKLELSLDGGGRSGDETPDLARLGVAVTRKIAGMEKGDAEPACEAGYYELMFEADKSMKQCLARDTGGCLAGGVRLLTSLIPDFETWPQRERLAVMECAGWKNGPRERVYVLSLQKQHRFRKALVAAADREATLR